MVDEHNQAAQAAEKQRQETLERNREAVERSHAIYEQRTKGRPTPTQEENDRAMLGEHILEHEHDGSDSELSGQQPYLEGGNARNMEPARGGSYATRQVSPSRTAAAPSSGHRTEGVSPRPGAGGERSGS